MERKIEFDFPGREPAPVIDYYTHLGGRDGINIRSKAAIALVEKIFDTLKNFKSEINEVGNEIVELFLETPRGTIEEFGNYEELHEIGEYESYEEFVESWKWYHPDPSEWYRFTSVKTDFNYLAIIMNDRISIICDPNDEYYGKWDDGMEVSLHPYLIWIDNALKRVIEMIKEGTYNDYVAKNVDIYSRTGTVLRSDIWKAFPEVKIKYFEEIGQENADEFISLVGKGVGINKPTERLKEMTVGLYLKVCELGYRLIYNDDDPALTPRELYWKHADGRDDGLLKLPDDDPIAFENWDPNSNENFNGHHPWEVIMGSSRTRVHLFPHKDENGYYFSLRGGGWPCSIETIKFFLAIYRAGYPIHIWDAKELVNRLLGTDKIGIVPHGVFPWYCEEDFPEEEIADFMNLYEEHLDLIPYIKWQEIKKVELK